MKKQNKKIEFDYFRPHYLKTNEDGITTESIYDFKAFLNYVSSNPLLNTKRKVLGDNHLFHVCRKAEGSNIWEIQILHLREQVLPGIANEDGAYELIKLSENQYPAESTTLLYDEEKYIIYVQRNIYGTSIRALTGLIQLISPEGTYVVLKPLMQNSKFDKVKSAKKHKKFILAVDSEQLTDREKDSNLGRIISSFSSYQGRIITIQIGFGRKKGQYLNSPDTVNLLKEAYEFSGTDKLIVDIMENDDSRIEKIDLLDDRKRFFIDIDYSRENPITHERLYWKCLETIRNM